MLDIVERHAASHSGAPTFVVVAEYGDDGEEVLRDYVLRGFVEEDGDRVRLSSRGRYRLISDR